MLYFSWLKGVLAYKRGRLAGSVLGVGLTVALLASLASFIVSSAASMTRQAIKEIPVDWQVQLVPGTDEKIVENALAKTISNKALEQVGYADVAGLSVTSGASTQVTGPGKVLGISDRYQRVFPGEVRLLLGSKEGVLLAQQTAANLHATVGDTVTIRRIGLPPVMLKIDGVVDLPYADSLFQAVGVPPSSAPQAPPDNVLLIPSTQWHQIFDPQAAVRPDSVRIQLHVRLKHDFSSDPVVAYREVQQLANNFEARIAGSGSVGNNLAARLGGVREDALYAKVLFLFLGLPGAIMAILLTLQVAASGGRKRRQEQALLRIRGASLQQILGLESTEAMISGIGGVLLGLLLASLSHQLIAPGFFLTGMDSLVRVAGPSIVGLVLAIAADIYPAWVQARHNTVMSMRTTVNRNGKSLSERIYLDVILLLIAAAVFWRTASTGYQLVLTPEGVVDTSVHYEAFLAPLCLWIGGVLLCRRISVFLLDRGRLVLGKMLSPIAGKLSEAVAASLSRQKKTVARGVLLVVLAISFAVSTAVFNATYQAQSHVDAQLTNGADVTIAGPQFSTPNSKLAELKAIPGVLNVQAMQHRYAYVGNDLQDLYGIDPVRIGEATSLSDAYFANGNAREALGALSKQPDGVLVSEETVRDFQLVPGDRLNLRLQDARNHQYHIIPFRFIGVVREFPTAPKDSFLVANASYIARVTGNDAREIVLIKTAGDSSKVAAIVRKVVDNMAGVKVTDLQSTQKLVGSSLSAVDLSGLTAIELVFAVLMVAGSTGLILALGLADRRRTFAILAALGAKSYQLGAFIWSEGLLILFGGGLIGTILGFGIAQMLVKLLTGVFDPPPEVLAIPWGYLFMLGLTAIAATVVVIEVSKRLTCRHALDELRSL